MNFSLAAGRRKSHGPIIAGSGISVKIADLRSEGKGSVGNKISARGEPSGALSVQSCFKRSLREVTGRNLLQACSSQAAVVWDRTFPCADAANVALTLSR